MKLRRIYKGASALSYWWLEGHEPVDHIKAAQRAAICVNCPLNQPEVLFEKPTRQLLSRYKAALASKYDRNLALPHDNHLKMCEGCGCLTVLKVWCPKEVIFKGGLPDYFNDLHKDCWIRQEANERTAL